MKALSEALLQFVDWFPQVDTLRMIHVLKAVVSRAIEDLPPDLRENKLVLQAFVRVFTVFTAYAATISEKTADGITEEIRKLTTREEEDSEQSFSE